MREIDVAIGQTIRSIDENRHEATITLESGERLVFFVHEYLGSHKRSLLVDILPPEHEAEPLDS